MSPVGKVARVIVDSHEPTRVAEFWAQLLGTPVSGSGAGWVDVGDISFVAVPEAKSVKNRLHLDVLVSDLGAATVQVQKLGAKPISAIYDSPDPWRVFADPEGNEFCLVTA
jgi:predicted enzyme related to lactoylglutathione lyase